MRWAPEYGARHEPRDRLLDPTLAGPAAPRRRPGLQRGGEPRLDAGRHPTRVARRAHRRDQRLLHRPYRRGRRGGRRRRVDLPCNLGYGGAVQTGFKYALAHGFEAILQIDADGQHDPKSAAALLAPVASGEADIAIGSRFTGKANYPIPLPRRIGMGVSARRQVRHAEALLRPDIRVPGDEQSRAALLRP